MLVVLIFYTWHGAHPTYKMILLVPFLSLGQLSFSDLTLVAFIYTQRENRLRESLQTFITLHKARAVYHWEVGADTKHSVLERIWVKGSNLSQ